jgi:hypothetical protein
LVAGSLIKNSPARLPKTRPTKITPDGIATDRTEVRRNESQEVMKPHEFEATPEFQPFNDAMRGILAVSKAEIDRRVKESKEESPWRTNPRAPGRKAVRSKQRNT